MRREIWLKYTVYDWWPTPQYGYVVVRLPRTSTLYNANLHYWAAKHIVWRVFAGDRLIYGDGVCISSCCGRMGWVCYAEYSTNIFFIISNEKHWEISRKNVTVLSTTSYIYFKNLCYAKCLFPSWNYYNLFVLIAKPLLWNVHFGIVNKKLSLKRNGKFFTCMYNNIIGWQCTSHINKFGGFRIK